MAVIIDSYSETNQSSQGGVRNGYSGDGQSFACGVSGYNLTSVKFYVKKTGSPTGNYYAELYAHTGTYGTSSQPTGSPLATSDTLDVSALTTSFQLKELTFSGAQQYALVNGTKYFIAIRYTGGDASNYLLVGGDDTSPTHGGNRDWLTDPSTWNVASGVDVCFYVYGDLAVIPTSIGIGTFL